MIGNFMPAGLLTATQFQTHAAPALLPSSAAFPHEHYPDSLIAGRAMPVLPHQAQVLFSAPELNDLPPVSSLYVRPYNNLTSG